MTMKKFAAMTNTHAAAAQAVTHKAAVAKTEPAAQAKAEEPAMIKLLDKPIKGVVEKATFDTWLKQETGELIPRFTVYVFCDGTQYQMTLWDDRAKKAAQAIRRGTYVKLDGQQTPTGGYTRSDGDYVPTVRVKGFMQKIAW